MAEKPPREETEKDRPAERRREWDRIDEAGWESFPASDPPAYGPPGDAAIEPPETADPEKGPPTEPSAGRPPDSDPE